MAGTFNHHPGGADPFSEVVADGVESRAMPTGYDELRERRRRQLRERQFEFPEGPPAAEHGHERHGSGDQFGREASGSLPTNFRKRTTHSSSGRS